jgi:hypothetical protein
MLIKVHDSQDRFTTIMLHSVPNSQEPQFMDAEGPRTSSAQGKDPKNIELRDRRVAKPFSNRPQGWSTEELVPNEKVVSHTHPRPI